MSTNTGKKTERGLLRKNNLWISKYSFIHKRRTLSRFILIQNLIIFEIHLQFFTAIKHVFKEHIKQRIQPVCQEKQNPNSQIKSNKTLIPKTEIYKGKQLPSNTDIYKKNRDRIEKKPVKKKDHTSRKTTASRSFGREETWKEVFKALGRET